VSPAKKAEPIKMLFGGWVGLAQGTMYIYGAADSAREGTISVGCPTG